MKVLTANSTSTNNISSRFQQAVPSNGVNNNTSSNNKSSDAVGESSPCLVEKHSWNNDHQRLPTNMRSSTTTESISKTTTTPLMNGFSSSSSSSSPFVVMKNKATSLVNKALAINPVVAAQIADNLASSSFAVVPNGVHQTTTTTKNSSSISINEPLFSSEDAADATTLRKTMMLNDNQQPVSSLNAVISSPAQDFSTLTAATSSNSSVFRDGGSSNNNAAARFVTPSSQLSGPLVPVDNFLIASREFEASISTLETCMQSLDTMSNDVVHVVSEKTAAAATKIHDTLHRKLREAYQQINQHHHHPPRRGGDAVPSSSSSSTEFKTPAVEMPTSDSTDSAARPVAVKYDWNLIEELRFRSSLAERGVRTVQHAIDEYATDSSSAGSSDDEEVEHGLAVSFDDDKWCGVPLKKRSLHRYAGERARLMQQIKYCDFQTSQMQNLFRQLIIARHLYKKGQLQNSSSSSPLVDPFHLLLQNRRNQCRPPAAAEDVPSENQQTSKVPAKQQQQQQPSSSKPAAAAAKATDKSSARASRTASPKRAKKPSREAKKITTAAEEEASKREVFWMDFKHNPDKMMVDLEAQLTALDRRENNNVDYGDGDATINYDVISPAASTLAATASVSTATTNVLARSSISSTMDDDEDEPGDSDIITMNNMNNSTSVLAADSHAPPTIVVDTVLPTPPSADEYTAVEQSNSNSNSKKTSSEPQLSTKQQQLQNKINSNSRMTLADLSTLRRAEQQQNSAMHASCNTVTVSTGMGGSYAGTSHNTHQPLSWIALAQLSGLDLAAVVRDSIAYLEQHPQRNVAKFMLHDLADERLLKQAQAQAAAAAVQAESIVGDSHTMTSSSSTVDVEFDAVSPTKQQTTDGAPVPESTEADAEFELPTRCKPAPQQLQRSYSKMFSLSAIRNGAVAADSGRGEVVAGVVPGIVRRYRLPKCHRYSDINAEPSAAGLMFKSSSKYSPSKSRAYTIAVDTYPYQQQQQQYCYRSSHRGSARALQQHADAVVSGGGDVRTAYAEWNLVPFNESDLLAAEATTPFDDDLCEHPALFNSDTQQTWLAAAMQNIGKVLDNKTVPRTDAVRTTTKSMPASDLYEDLALLPHRAFFGAGLGEQRRDQVRREHLTERARMQVHRTVQKAHRDRIKYQHLMHADGAAKGKDLGRLRAHLRFIHHAEQQAAGTIGGEVVNMTAAEQFVAENQRGLTALNEKQRKQQSHISKQQKQHQQQQHALPAAAAKQTRKRRRANNTSSEDDDERQQREAADSDSFDYDEDVAAENDNNNNAGKRNKQNVKRRQQQQNRRRQQSGAASLSNGGSSNDDDQDEDEDSYDDEAALLRKTIFSNGVGRFDAGDEDDEDEDDEDESGGEEGKSLFLLGSLPHHASHHHASNLRGARVLGGGGSAGRKRRDLQYSADREYNQHGKSMTASAMAKGGRKKPCFGTQGSAGGAGGRNAGGAGAAGDDPSETFVVPFGRFGPARVEKLDYKEIKTPQWRRVDIVVTTTEPTSGGDAATTTQITSTTVTEDVRPSNLVETSTKQEMMPTNVNAPVKSDSTDGGGSGLPPPTVQESISLQTLEEALHGLSVNPAVNHDELMKAFECVLVAMDPPAAASDSNNNGENSNNNTSCSLLSAEVSSNNSANGFSDKPPPIVVVIKKKQQQAILNDRLLMPPPPPFPGRAPLPTTTALSGVTSPSVNDGLNSVATNAGALAVTPANSQQQQQQQDLISNFLSLMELSESEELDAAAAAVANVVAPAATVTNDSVSGESLMDRAFENRHSSCEHEERQKILEYLQNQETRRRGRQSASSTADAVISKISAAAAAAAAVAAPEVVEHAANTQPLSDNDNLASVTATPDSQQLSSEELLQQQQPPASVVDAQTAASALSTSDAEYEQHFYENFIFDVGYELRQFPLPTNNTDSSNSSGIDGCSMRYTIRRRIPNGSSSNGRLPTEMTSMSSAHVTPTRLPKMQPMQQRSANSSLPPYKLENMNNSSISANQQQQQQRSVGGNFALLKAHGRNAGPLKNIDQALMCESADGDDAAVDEVDDDDSADYTNLQQNHHHRTETAADFKNKSVAVDDVLGGSHAANDGFSSPHTGNSYRLLNRLSANNSQYPPKCRRVAVGRTSHERACRNVCCS